MKNRRKWHWASLAVVVMGILLTTGAMWARILDPLIYNAAGDFRNNGLFSTLSPFLYQLSAILSFGWYYGIWVLLAGFGAAAFTMPETKMFSGFFPDRRFSAAVLAVPVGAHLLVAAFSMQFFFVPAGESIRPMGWAMLMFRISTATLILGLPLAFISLLREKPKTYAIVGTVLCCTPFFLSSAILHLAAAIKGFELSQ